MQRLVIIRASKRVFFSPLSGLLFFRASITISANGLLHLPRILLLYQTPGALQRHEKYEVSVRYTYNYHRPRRRVDNTRRVEGPEIP